MCRLFGLHAGAPVDAEFWLIDAPDSLSAQSHRNPDGAGVGAFTASGRPRSPSNRSRPGRTPPSRVPPGICTARPSSRTSGTPAPARTRWPTRTRSCRTGGCSRTTASCRACPSSASGSPNWVPPRLVRGETDSERVFALITGETRRHGGDLGRGITAAVGWIAGQLPVYAVNLVLATATDVWALRYPATHELYVLDRPAGGPAPATRWTHGVPGSTRGRRTSRAGPWSSSPANGWTTTRPGGCSSRGNCCTYGRTSA